MVRPDRERLLVMRDGFLRTSERVERVAEIVMGVGVLAVERERRPIACDRLLEAGEPIKHGADARLDLCRARRCVGDPSEQHDGLIDATLFGAN
jgi:hypothetical protein